MCSKNSIICYCNYVHNLRIRDQYFGDGSGILWAHNTVLTLAQMIYWPISRVYEKRTALCYVMSLNFCCKYMLSQLTRFSVLRRSFPSAHASCSMYGMLFLAVCSICRFPLMWISVW